MQSLAREIVKYLLIAGLLMYLVFGVLKPLIRELITIGESEPRSRNTGSNAEDDGFNSAGGDVVTLGGARPHSYEDDLKLVKDMAKADPKIVANVVKDWVSKE